MTAFVRAGAACLCLLFPFHADAACSVAATNINFGIYDVFVAGPLDSTGTVTVACDRRTDVTISIGPSATSGMLDPRAMRHLSRPDRLNYNLFTNASRSAIWGDGTAGTSTVFIPNVRRGIPETRTIYGRIPPGQDVSVGAYGEFLTITITP